MKKKPLTALTTAELTAAPIPDLATQAHEGTPQYGDYGHLATEPEPALPPDHRADGGNVFDLRNEQTTL